MKSVNLNIYVMVFTGYTPAVPTFFTKLQHAVAMVAAYTVLAFQTNHSPTARAMQMVAPMATIFMSLGNRLVPVPLVPAMHARDTTL